MTKLLGTKPNQAPTNADLGDLAYQDGANSRIGPITVTGGNVGIGTSSPGSQLDVFNDSGDSTIRIHSDANDATLIMDVAAATDFAPIIYRVAGSEVGRVQYDYANDAYIIYVNSSEAMRIDSSGNFGIGTSSPTQKLQVHGSDGNDVYTRISNADSGTSSGLLLGLNGNEEGIVRVEPNKALIFGTNNTERMRIDSSGNVGIGTTGSGGKLEVRNDGTGAVMQRWFSDLGVYDRNISLRSPASDSATAPWTWETSNSWEWQVDAATAMVIDSSGNVGIGTSSPVTLLDIGPKDGADEGAEVKLRGATNGTVDWNMDVYISDFRIFTTAKGSTGSFTERLRIDSSGNVGIGTNSPSALLDVDGTTRLGGAVTLAGVVSGGDNEVNRVKFKDISETVVTANSGATYTIDLENGNVFKITLTDNCTFTFSNPPATGNYGSFRLELIQDGTGSRTATMPASVDWPDGTAPTLTTTATTGKDVLFFETTDAGTTWLGYVSGQAFS